MTMGEPGNLDRIKELLEPEGALVERVVSGGSVFSGKIFEAEVLDVELSDGSHGYREIVRHHGGAGVVAVRDGKVCLVRQYRVALGRMTLEIPAGKLEAGEDAGVCAARELAEETGLVAERLEPLARSWGSPGFTDECTRVYMAHGLTQGLEHPDEGEFVRSVWLPLEDVVAAIRAGLICDAKTIIGVFAAVGGIV